MYSLQELMEVRFNNHEDEIPSKLLCLDPGNETGWALFEEGKLTKHGQVITCVEKGGTNGAACIIDWAALGQLFADIEPTVVVCENYRVYAHKLERHSFSEVPTLRLIGGIDQLCCETGIEIHYLMAVNHKPFVTDAKLKNWGLWKSGMRHSRDAIRLGIYYLIVESRKK